jgi:Bacterial lectin/Secretion system C-terminal sorting domain
LRLKLLAMKQFVTLLLFGLFSLSTTSIFGQTTIINPANATGTSGADGSFQNATNTFPANNWLVVNDVTNRWFVGTTATCAGTKGAYVGTAAGNNNYTNTTTQVSHFYKDVTFPAGQTCIVLSFSWKCAGEGGFDGIRVSLGSTTVTPVASTLFTTSDPTAVELGNSFYNNNTTCNTATITIPAANAGTTKRLVFSWINDASVGTNPAATVDAVSLVSQNATIPSCATALVPANGATAVSTCNPITWTAPASTGCNTATSYDIYYGTSASPGLLTNTTATSYQPTMNFSTTYYYQIVPRNAAGPAVGCPVLSFTSAASTNPQYNLVDDATSVSPFNCVTLTPDLLSQRGCAWDANSVMNFAANFSYDIDVNLGSNDGGADGMAFVFQNDPLGRCKCGTVGGALGAGGITNSVVVELDTYINFEDRDDFVSPTIGTFGTEEPDHLDIWFGGNVNPDLDFDADAVAPGERPAAPNAARLQNPPGTNYNIENGLTHKFRIAWNAGTQTMTASVLNSALTITYGTISATFNPITIFGTNTPYFGFTASTGGLSNTQSFCLPTVLLPVEISSFDANCIDGKVRLDWSTESERDNDFFTIEQSCDGENFTFAQQIKSKGDAYNQQNYATVLETICSGMNYYRLSQTDINGNRKDFAIKSVNSCSAFEEVYIYPNPANNQINVAWNNMSMVSVEIIDALGHQLLVKEINSKAITQVEIPTTNFSNGVYFVKVNQQFGSKMYKIVIEKAD